MKGGMSLDLELGNALLGHAWQQCTISPDCQRQQLSGRHCAREPAAMHALKDWLGIRGSCAGNSQQRRTPILDSARTIGDIKETEISRFEDFRANFSLQLALSADSNSSRAGALHINIASCRRLIQDLRQEAIVLALITVAC
jgi:hypothetical protein